MQSAEPGVTAVRACQPEEDRVQTQRTVDPCGGICGSAPAGDKRIAAL